MTLFSLARKNIIRNFSQYFLYIASMVLSVVIYFTFATMKYSETILKEAETSKKISSIMSSSSVILIIFVVIFIFYSNSFFVKKRKKEVGLYSLLGVRKKSIGFMLFFENLLLGFVSLIIGIFIGFLTSKFFFFILFKMMGYEVAAEMTLSLSAIINTIIVFGIIFIFTSLQGYRVVYKFKLIELFHASKQGEKIPKPNIFVALLGVALVGFAYYVALENFVTSATWKLLGVATPLMIIAFVVIGTYLLFHSVTGFILSVGKKIEKFSWKNLRLLTLSQLLYRIRGNARTLTIIATLSATTITAGGAVFGLYYNMKSSAEISDPNTYMYVETKTTNQSEIEALTKDANYRESVTMLTTKFDANELKDDFGAYGNRVYNVLSEDDYNRLAALQNKKIVSLSENEGIMIDPGYNKAFSPIYKGRTIKSNAENFTLREVEKENVLNNAASYMVVIVPNDQFEKLKKTSESTTVQAIGDKKADVKEAKQLKALMTDENKFSSYELDLKDGMESIGVILFVGSFLGLVFLAATGSIIYFKVLTEAEEDRNQFMMLHKMGVSFKEMKKSIATQVAVIFFIPLVVGILHSVIALKALSALLAMNMFTAVLIWIAVYSLIYATYYIITVRSYNKIIKNTLRNEA